MNNWFKARLYPLRWPLLLVAITLLLIAGLVLTAHSPKRGASGVTAIQVQTLQATPDTLRPSLRLYGRVETPQQAQLSAALNAYVQQVRVREGDRVAVGELLVALDPRDAQLVLAQRQADLEDARAKLAAESARYQADQAALKQERELLAIAQRAVTRQQTLVKKNLTSQTLLDDARKVRAQQSLMVISREREISDHDNRQQQLQAALERAQALLDSAQLELERSQLSAPFSGRIAQLNVAVGERLRVGDGVLSLYPDDQLELRVQIPSRLVPQLRQAMAGEIRPDAYLLAQGRKLSLVLDRLAAEVLQGRGGVDAFFRLRQDDDRLALELGRAVEVEVSLPPVAETIALPSNALYGSDRIYRVEEGLLQALRVERVGQRPGAQGTEVLVRSAQLRAGDQILLTRIPNAISGMAVQPRNQEPVNSKQRSETTDIEPGQGSAQ